MVRKEESEKPAAAGAGRAKRLALRNNKQFKNWIASQRGGDCVLGGAVRDSWRSTFTCLSNVASLACGEQLLNTEVPRPTIHNFSRNYCCFL